MIPSMGIKREKANSGLYFEVCATKKNKIHVLPCDVGMHCSEEGRGNMAKRSQLYFPSFSEAKKYEPCLN